MIKAILACDEKWGIGKNNNLPWPYNANDLQWFKQQTMGGVVAMGKNTWDSLPQKPLPGRNNVVVTSSEDDKNGPYHFLKFDQAASHLKSMAVLSDVWVIGGAQLLTSLLDIVGEIHLSRIEGDYSCDTFLPESLILEKFELLEVQDIPEKRLYIEIWGRK